MSDTKIIQNTRKSDFSKELLIKVLIEATKNFLSKNWSVKSKFCFLQIFVMVLTHSELEGFVHMTKIEKQVRFWNYLIFGRFAASQRATNINQTKGSNFLSDLHQFPPKMCFWELEKLLNPFPTLGNALRTYYLVYFGHWRPEEDIVFSTWF